MQYQYAFLSYKQQCNMQKMHVHGSYIILDDEEWDKQLIYVLVYLSF